MAFPRLPLRLSVAAFSATASRARKASASPSQSRRSNRSRRFPLFGVSSRRVFARRAVLLRVVSPHILFRGGRKC